MQAHAIWAKVCACQIARSETVPPNNFLWRSVGRLRGKRNSCFVFIQICPRGRANIGRMLDKQKTKRPSHVRKSTLLWLSLLLWIVSSQISPCIIKIINIKSELHLQFVFFEKLFNNWEEDYITQCFLICEHCNNTFQSYPKA